MSVRMIYRALLWLGLVLLIVTLLLVVSYRVLPVGYTPLMGIRALQGVWPQDRQWLSLDRTGPMPLAVVAAEDQRFTEHWGLDLQAIQFAIQYNDSHRRKRGASTISQQTAKNLFLWPGRDWLRKGLELWFTLWIEALWPKQRILEVYLNIIEFGPGLYGVEAASRHWFSKPAARLSRSEAAALAVMLPNPLKTNPRRLGARLQARRSWVLHQMGNLETLRW